ncbi:hypothetical protein [Clostridium sp.]|uniref:hypothetical protein n=1 Tax=Clostridium sp. TaxID=1506 RepID=UPI001A3B435D|nr:hypothetical protein [Clostridium sp.]MBK5241023.1 hypothetical protein [Clostridium sp.]
MLKNNFNKCIIALIILISLTTISYFITNTNADELVVEPSTTISTPSIYANMEF